MQTIDFLDAIKRRHEIQSDYALAKLLKVRQTRISHYRRGVSCFDADMALKVAEMLEMPSGYVLACIEEERAERTKRPQVQAAWHQVAKSLAPLFAAAVMGFSVAGTPTSAKASSEVAGKYTLYEARRRRGVFLRRMPQARRSPRGRPRTSALPALFPLPKARLRHS